MALVRSSRGLERLVASAHKVPLPESQAVPDILHAGASRVRALCRVPGLSKDYTAPHVNGKMTMLQLA
eukprot:2440044-Alexandrium_andersonii.AAC.1